MINSIDLADKKVLVLAKRNWHHGIIGVVASRICERYNKTCILISIEDEWCKSSGRSVEGINLFDFAVIKKYILEKAEIPQLRESEVTNNETENETENETV